MQKYPAIVWVSLGKYIIKNGVNAYLPTPFLFFILFEATVQIVYAYGLA